MEIFYREKAFHAREKIRKNDFAPSEKFSCYAPAFGDKISKRGRFKNLKKMFQFFPLIKFISSYITEFCQSSGNRETYLKQL